MEQVTSALTLDVVLERARGIVPVLREHARESEILTHTAPAVIEAAADAGLFETMVPKRFGGHGLGVDALCFLARELAHGDVSAAWSICFMIEHNWMACHLSMEAQEELYADRNYILAAGPLGPSGKAKRVEDGYLVSGPWKYASALPNSDYNLVGAMVEEPDGPRAYVFLVPKSDLTVFDDWKFSGMSGTGSVSSTCDDLFVPDRFALPYDNFLSPLDHDGALHEETHLRQLVLPGLWLMQAGYAVGGLERMVELFRERLETSALGTKRIDQALSRVRWAEAHQMARCAVLLFEQAVRDMLESGEGYWPDDEGGQCLQDAIWIIHMCKDGARLIADGSGTSAFSLDNPIQRYLRDLTVIANHAANDWDNTIERTSRHVLGLGRQPSDPYPTSGPEGAASTARAYKGAADVGRI